MTSPSCMSSDRDQRGGLHDLEGDGDAVQARGGKQEGERRHGGQWMSRAEEHPVADRRPLPVLAFLSIHGPRGPRKLALGGSLIARRTCGGLPAAGEIISE